MRIVPVVDLQRGVVVRGRAGRRAEYRPVSAAWLPSSAPADVGRAWVAQWGCSTCYVADLDAIAGHAPNLPAYEALMAAGLALWVDAGLASREQLDALAAWRGRHGPLAGIVAGLETLPSPEFLDELRTVAGAERAIFSLDLMAGAPLTRVAAWQSAEPRAIADEVLARGVSRLIVLDLARVGVDSGTGTDALLADVRARHPQVELIAGGGIRGLADLERLAALGCSAALVASVLYDGRVTPDDLMTFAR